jgi:hypothetical protein
MLQMQGIKCEANVGFEATVFSAFFHVKTPTSILAPNLIAIGVCCGKAVKVPFIFLFFVNSRGGNLNKTGVA